MGKKPRNDATLQRYRLIAAYVKNRGADSVAVESAADHYDCSESTIRRACDRFKLKIRPAQQGYRDAATLEVYRDIVNMKKGQSLQSIADNHGYDRQRVHQIFQQAKKLKLPVPAFKLITGPRPSK